MKGQRSLIGLLAIIFVLLLPTTAFAQTNPVSPSAGCTALTNVTHPANPSHAFVSYAFTEGETIRVTLSGTGTEFTLLEGGSVVVGPVAAGNSLTYVIPATQDYLFSINVTGSAADTQINVSCTPSDTIPPDDDDDDDDDDGDDDDEKVTICHIPPGNAAAAHTISVSRSALRAHLGHGDIPGNCPPGIDTRYDNPTAGIVIYIIYQTGEITIYGDCTGDTCIPVIDLPVRDIINIDIDIVIQEIDFIYVVNPIEIDIDELDENGDGDDDDYEDDDGDGHDDYSIRVFYLHPFPSNSRIGVFQINIYKNDGLIDDSILIFVDRNGKILLWTTHRYWLQNNQTIVLEN